MSTLHDLFSVVIGSYELLVHPRSQPNMWNLNTKRARIVENIDDSYNNPLTCFIVVNKNNKGCLFALKLTFEPQGGVYPGVVLIPETDVLFIGAGETLLAYRLDEPSKLWHDTNDAGFHSWARYDDVIVMSAELEVAAWNIRGEKLWSMYVEPPYGYTVKNGIVHMDRMEGKLEFPLEAGPDKWRNTPRAKES
jgi:hypothetical protein